jgi:plastocyanin
VSRGQRFAFLAVAVVIAVVAVVVLAGGSDDNGNPESTGDEQSAATATATPTGTPTGTPTATPTPKPPPLLQSGKVAKITVKQGDTVRFRVRSPEAEEVHVHTYDIKKDLEPNQTATVALKADITGIFEIEFEHSGEQIAELRVNPG